MVRYAKNKQIPMVVLKRLGHYVKDLRCIQVPDGTGGAFVVGDDHFRITYSRRVPENLLDELEVKSSHLIDEHTRCLLVYYRDSSVGCFLWNSRGKAEHLKPFKHTMDFGPRHAYGLLLFVKHEFRGRSLSKYLYREIFSLVKRSFDYFDVFIANDNLISRNTAMKMGFAKTGEIVFCKMLFIKFLIRLNAGWKIRVFDVFVRSMRQIIRTGKLTISLVSSAIRKFVHFKNKSFVNVYVVSDPQQTIKVLYIGKKVDNVILNKIFPKEYDIEFRGRCWRKDIVKKVRYLSCKVDAVFVEETIEYLRKRVFPSGEGVKYIPKWVLQINHDPGVIRTLTKSKNRSVLKSIKAAQNRGYEYVFSQDLNMLPFFYYHMYVPYIRRRHSQEAVLPSFGEIKKYFNRGGLCFVKEKEKYVAAGVIELNGDTLSSKKIGVLNGDTAFLKKNVLPALHLFYFRLARERKIKKIDFGLSQRFLNDGVLQHKAKWLAKIELYNNAVLAMKICRFSSRMKEFLKENPFISVEGTRLVGNVFYDENKKADYRADAKRYGLPGLYALEFFSLSQTRYEKTATINCENGQTTGRIVHPKESMLNVSRDFPSVETGEIKRRYFPFVFRCVRWLWSRMKIRPWKLFILRESGGNHGARIAVICRSNPDRSLMSKLFPAGQEIEKQEKFSERYFDRVMEECSPHVDMIIIDSTLRHLKRRFHSWDNVKFVPQWVVQKTSSFTRLNDFQKIRRNKNRSAYYDIKAVEKAGFEFEFSKDPRLFRFFWQHMYLPYMNTRHGENKTLPPFKMAHKAFRQGGLFFVKKDGRYLAGAVAELRKPVFHPMFLGILDGDVSLLKKHVITGLYYAYFLFVQNRGDYSMIDFGLSRAFLNDGTLRYKAKWNALAEYDFRRSNIYAFRFIRYSPQIKRFLTDNPFISIENDALIGNLFVDTFPNQNIDTLERHYALPGILGMDVAVFKGNAIEHRFCSNCKDQDEGFHPRDINVAKLDRRESVYEYI